MVNGLSISPDQNTSAEASASEIRLHKFLRGSHIFSASVGEILGTKFLQEVSPDPLTVLQFHLLKLIKLNGRRQVGEVAECLGVTSPAATKNIDKLERLGLITRTPSKGDRRATLLSVSTRGRKLVDAYEELKTARMAPVLDRFNPEEIEQFSDLLERFSVSMLDLEQPGRGFCLRCAMYIESNCPIGQVLGGCPYDKPHGERRNEGVDQ